ncbi:MAG: radical SAM protein [Candidatus Heimdallarchaeota archaeon]|nr:MAG: radical SAM protein [Candidatus Heimdallarchaeota archaeon]
MKILLISPPFNRLKGIGHFHFPLGLGYLAAAVADKGVEVRIYDSELPQKGEDVKPLSNVFLLDAHRNFTQSLKESNHPVWREVYDTLNYYQPDIVGMTVFTPLYGSARKITSLCKDFNNKCIVIWGGPHPTLLAEEVMQKEKGVDFVVRGEGEVTFRELVRHLTRGKQAFHEIDGLSYRAKGEIKHNKTRDLIQDLDELPFPRRDLLLNDISDNRIFNNIMGSRGCPYNCAYCSSTQFWNRRVRFRSVTNIIGEMKHLKRDFHVTELEFWDDSFTLNREWTTELCNNMISQKLNLSWWCNTRPDLIDEEKLKIMKKAGCTAINIGIETGSEKTLSYLNRNLSLEDISNSSKLLRKMHIDWYAYFMLGFPYETVEDIEHTRGLMRSLSASHITLSIFNPYPKTRLFEISRKLGFIPDDFNWSQFSHQSPNNHFIKNVSKDEFRKIVREAAEECDRINKSFIKKVRRIITKRHYYYRNPLVFFKKIKKLMYCSPFHVSF